MLTVRVRKRIREWQSAKAKLQAADTLGGNVMKEKVENHLMNAGPVAFDFECSDFSQGASYSCAKICEAGQVSSSFIASNGWVQKFMAKNGRSVRRRTTESQKNPDRLMNKLIGYILQV